MLVSNNEKLFDFIHHYSTYADVKIIDNELNETITKTSYEVDTSPTIQIHYNNPALTLLSFYPSTSLSSNPFKENLTFSKQIDSMKEYPILDIDKNVQVFHLYIDPSQFPLEITFSDELVKQLNLPSHTIELKQRK